MWLRKKFCKKKVLPSSRSGSKSRIRIRIRIRIRNKLQAGSATMLPRPDRMTNIYHTCVLALAGGRRRWFLAAEFHRRWDAPGRSACAEAAPLAAQTHSPTRPGRRQSCLLRDPWERRGRRWSGPLTAPGGLMWTGPTELHNGFNMYTLVCVKPVLGIRDILVRIRIPGSLPLINGSGSNSDPTPFFIEFKGSDQ